ncbi:hypothetical protein [uncultured Sphingomonas sp.]|uniref:hypothetical protein n=1 Tax=uncultured Sphingomonas sp. TaxID=158754 RepID=UPI0025EEB6EC|nr:hypothetical protein [uncultured Sphingomonas sp.]
MKLADLVEAARGAVFRALEAAHTAANTATPVCDHLLQDVRRRFVKVDDLDWTNEGSKSEPALRITVDVVTVYQGGDRAELIALMGVNDDALHDVTLVADGVIFAPAELIAGSATGAASDGKTYAGAQTYEIFAEAA